MPSTVRSTCQATRSLFLSTVSLAAFAASPAAAQTWIGTTPDWNNTANWSTGAVPTGAGTVVIKTGGTVFPSLSGIAATANILQVGAVGSAASLSLLAGASMNAYSTSIGNLAGETGLVQVAGPTTRWTNNFLYAGFNGNGTLALSGGAAASFETVNSAVFAGSVGAITLTGANTSFYSLNGHVIGDGGQGSLSISAGARADDKGVTLGFNTGARGTATISGTGSSWNIRAGLAAGRQGYADLNISDEGRVAVASNAFFGQQVGATGNLAIDGAGSRLDTGGYTVLGEYGQGSAILSGGAVHQTQQGIMGWQAGSRGDLRVTGANSLWQGMTYLMVGNLGSAEATFDNGGTVRLNGGTRQVIIANGAGSTGTVNIGAPQGATARAPGFLDAATIRFGLGTGKLVFNHTASDYAVDAAITGSGTLIAENGTTILRGANTFTGATEVRGGTIVVNSSIASSSGLTVAAGATVSGSGQLPSLTVNGTLAPGNSPGTLTVNGNLVMGVASTYIAEVQGAVADRVNVTGTASLAGTLRIVPLGGAYNFSAPYALLSAAGGLGGTKFGAVDTTGSFGDGVKTSVAYTGNDVLLTLTPKPLAPIVTPSLGVRAPRNAASIAAAIDGTVANGANPSALFGIYNLPAAAIPAAVNSLSGEVHTAAPAMANNAASQFLGTMLDGSGTGRLSGVPGGPGGATSFTADLPSRQDGPGRGSFDPARFSLWGATFGSTGRNDGDRAVGSANRNLSDGYVAVGADIRLGSNTIVGAAVGGGQSRASLSGGLGKAEADVFQAGLYGRTRLGSVNLAAALGYARLDTDTSRAIPALGLTGVAASYATQAWSGRLEASLPVASWGGLTLSPLAAFQAVRASSPAAIERDVAGAGPGLLTLARRSDMTSRSELGLQLDANLLAGATPVTGFVRAAWAHYYQRDADLTAALSGLPGASFAATGARPDRNAALLAAGADIRLSPTVSLGMRVDSELSGNTRRVGGTAQLRVSF